MYVFIVLIFTADVSLIWTIRKQTAAHNRPDGSQNYPRIS